MRTGYWIPRILATNMRQRICQHCGKEFASRSCDNYLCPDCSAAYHKQATLRTRICRQCGATFVGGPRAWYCPDCRAVRQAEASRRAKANGPQRPIGSIDKCKVCGAEYTVTGGRQRYCPSCKEAATRENIRRRSREYNAENREALRQKADNRRAASRAKVCIICGQPFESSTPRVTCSDACDQIRKKLRQAEADIRRGRKRNLPMLPKNGADNSES